MVPFVFPSYTIGSSSHSCDRANHCKVIEDFNFKDD